MFMTIQTAPCRESSASLAYSPNDKLHDFVLKLKTKFDEKKDRYEKGSHSRKVERALKIDPG